jgi:hypothetical protein
MPTLQELACPVWLSRKVARLSRRVSVDRVWVIDAAVAEAISGEAPGRVLAICEAKVIEAAAASHAGMGLPSKMASAQRSGYASRQCGRHRYVWRTPLGRHYLLRRPHLPARVTGREITCVSQPRFASSRATGD